MTPLSLMNIVWQVHLNISSNHPLRSFQYVANHCCVQYKFEQFKFHQYFRIGSLCVPPWSWMAEILQTMVRNTQGTGLLWLWRNVTFSWAFRYRDISRFWFWTKWQSLLWSCPSLLFQLLPWPGFFLERYDKIDWTKYFVQYDRNVSKKCLTC